MTSPNRAVPLTAFRYALYLCLPRWGDALFELADAVLCVPGPVGSVPSLSLEPEFRRSHGSLYKALARGRIDEERLRSLLVAVRPDGPQVFAVDASTWDRQAAECSPERGFYHSASKQTAGQPVAAGWSYQWIAQLSWEADSWTAPLDMRRLPPLTDTTLATVDQVRSLVGRLPAGDEVPLFVFDAGYDPIRVGHGLADTRAQVLVRIRNDRVFYTDPPPRPAHTNGRPPRHGNRFKLSEPHTMPEPDSDQRTDDPRYGTMRVRVWHNVHPRLLGRGRRKTLTIPPIVRGSVISVDIEHLPKRDSRAHKPLWLWWSGPGTPDLDMCVRAYLHRFDLEHTFRFVKNTLGWTAPALQNPAQADRWTWLIIVAYTQLRLARGIIDDLRLPWERPCDPAKLTPNRVRRGFRRARAIIGTPASPPKTNTPGPGRPKGTTRPARTRYPVIKRAA
jgi:hypothetical protein